MSKHHLLLKSINKAYYPENHLYAYPHLGSDTSSEWNFCARFLRRHFAGNRVIGPTKCRLLSSQRESSSSGGATRSHAKGDANARGGSLARSLEARRLAEGHWHTIKKITGTSVLTCTTFLIVLLKRPSSCEEGNSNSFYKKHIQEKNMLPAEYGRDNLT